MVSKEGEIMQQEKLDKIKNDVEVIATQLCVLASHNAVAPFIAMVASVKQFKDIAVETIKDESKNIENEPLIKNLNQIIKSLDLMILYIQDTHKEDKNHG
jgi:hypothetical protein